MQNPVLKRSNWKQYIISGSFAAGLYGIFTYFFIRNGRFENTWWLYAGNGFFMVAICLYCLKRTLIDRVKESAMNTVLSANLVTIAGIIISCIIDFLLVVIFVPGVFGPSEGAGHALIAEPPTMPHNETSGLLLILFTNATIGNFVAGSVISVLTAYSVERSPKNTEQEKKER